jgi:hypothetical protein
MAVIMISELPGAGPGFADVARQQGLFDKMKSAPGFMGHWSGADRHRLSRIRGVGIA